MLWASIVLILVMMGNGGVTSQKVEGWTSLEVCKKVADEFTTKSQLKFDRGFCVEVK
jgi:hypothetical protein